MSFLNPWGLLGLIGIPVLILIYILKPKFEEKTVSSTFIWKLSLKYKKKRIPMQWLRRSLLFILQLLAITLVSLILAHPVVNSSEGTGEQIVILDASGSMMASDGNETRFERAIAEIEKQAAKLGSNDKMSVITASAEASFLIQRSDSARAVKQALKTAVCTYEDCSIPGAIALADSLLEDNPDAQITIYTDKDYETSGNIRIINVSDGEWNAAVLSLTASKNEQMRYIFTSELVSYGADAEVTAALFIDGELVSADFITLTDSEILSVVWDSTDITEYSEAELFLEVSDSIETDNLLYCFNDTVDKQVLIVSSASTFLQTVFRSMKGYEVTVVTSLDDAELTGYDLYIFDCLTPDYMPSDGAVWLINPSTAPEGAEFTIGGTKSGEFYLSAAPDPDTDTYAVLTEYLEADTIAVSDYRVLVNQEGYDRILTADQSTLVFAGCVNSIRTVVFTFDLHNSNLPLLIAYPEIVNSILDYLLPPALEYTLYSVGDTITISASSGTKLITLEGPTELLTFYDFPVLYTPTAPGLFNVLQTYSAEENASNADTFYVRLPISESCINSSGGLLAVNSSAENADVSYQKELWLYLLAALLVIILIEWEVQYHEQF